MKDQTHNAATIAEGHVQFGTAVLLVRQPDGSNRKMLRQAGSYREYLEMGDNPLVVAGKWVPESVMPFQQLVMTNCQAVVCVDRCVHPGCICDEKLGVCV